MKGFKLYLVSLLILVCFSIGWRTPRSIDTSELFHPINMSLQDSLLLVTDASNGVHVYDVKDPAAPVAKYVIPLRGARGTAAKDDIMFTNDYKSLLAIRVEADTFTVVKSIEDWETHPIMPMDGMVDGGYGCGCFAEDAVAPSTSGSVGGSYATFAVIDSFLYYFNYSHLVTMDISQPDNPTELSRTPIEWGVETIYPTDEYLFLGGNRGMYIYDRSNPTAPIQIGRMEHFRACDPVVVSGDLAFVTLRGGNACGQSTDILLVVDIKNPSKPVAISETAIKTPYGLALDFPLLYVSMGHYGCKLLDVATPDAPSDVNSWSDPETKDFIWFGDVLYVMSFADVKIYDVTSPDAPALLSQLD
jgi:hypothetical protein